MFNFSLPLLCTCTWYVGVSQFLSVFASPSSPSLAGCLSAGGSPYMSLVLLKASSYFTFPATVLIETEAF